MTYCDTLQPTDFLLALDACVKRDVAAPGLQGTICVGVRTDAYERWWSVTLGAKTATALGDTVPAIADAALLLGAREAEALLRLEPLPERPELFELRGDRDLVVRFLDRYLTQQSWLDVRIGAARTPRR